MRIFVLLVCLFLHRAAIAAPQDHALIKSAVNAFVQQQLAGEQGKVSINVDEIDKRLTLRACNRLEPFLPAGSQLIGRILIGVRCDEPGGWSMFVPVQIRISRELIVSARSLTMGQILHAEDLARQTVETSQNTGLTDANQVIGKVLRYSITAGYILRSDMLRAPYFVKQGQSVQLSVQGSGFVLSSSGVALNNASEGEPVQIRTSAGRVISGIASGDGVVRINP